ncbi:MAG: PD40 domain-containing protein [Paludibacteraceae bacterium]|nr:PD40 domain-containing protein [Paludibacteraceae bacterium]
MNKIMDRIISKLEIYDLKTASHRIIKEFPYLIEAPNWSPDGKWIIFNSNGKLYRIATDGTSEAEAIESGIAIRCNNDHVISSDGKFIAVSHHTQEDGLSRIYVLPFEGGEARCVTPDGPSYLHGWSPDMKSMAYCAFRGDAHVVHTMELEEGIEKAHTRAEEGLSDGPEYSPDGKHIWFNWVKTGLMQIWRMRADGSEQTQMTFDENLNSWFPHVSPDGKWVVFIAYRKGDLKPDEHLPNKNVILRIMPAEGGEPQTIVELFGGQGTINVNSWAPDSQQFAYVSYELK